MKIDKDTAVTLQFKVTDLQGKLIDLHNSGDTAGERSRVVGYGAFAFFESEFKSEFEAKRHVH